MTAPQSNAKNNIPLFIKCHNPWRHGNTRNEYLIDEWVVRGPLIQTPDTENNIYLEGVGYKLIEGDLIFYPESDPLVLGIVGKRYNITREIFDTDGNPIDRHELVKEYYDREEITPF